ncbi:MAG TPA: insulinase family protein, partial [Longimicrobiales bacterium]|nr:insulinase family protein [Longimicrobiales bacterium]
MCNNPGRGLAILLGLLVQLGPGSPAAAQEPARHGDIPGLGLDVVDHTLDNGLRVLALRREGAPTASFVLRFDVGSVNERPGETGIAHFLEHLLFKGTTTIGTSDLEAERALFRRMDAVHDTLLDARSAGDTARVTILAARIDSLEDRARALIRPNEFDRLLTENGARDMNATTS